MNLLENELNCSECGKAVGLLSRVVNGTNHDLSISIICMNCLPMALDKATERKYNPAIIDRVRGWVIDNQLK